MDPGPHTTCGSLCLVQYKQAKGACADAISKLIDLLMILIAL